MQVVTWPLCQKQTLLTCCWNASRKTWGLFRITDQEDTQSERLLVASHIELSHSSGRLPRTREIDMCPCRSHRKDIGEFDTTGSY